MLCERIMKQLKAINLFLILVVTVVVLFQSSLRAQENMAQSITVAPMFSFYHFDEDRDLDNTGRLNLSTGYNITAHWAAEYQFGYTFTDNIQEDTVNVLWNYADILYHYRPDRRWVPYALVGVGLTSEIGDVDNHTRVNWDYGIGMKFFLSDLMAIRSDVRGYYEPQDHYTDYAFNLGFHFQIGGASGMKHVSFDDRYCRDIPAEYLVDEWGCPVYHEQETRVDLDVRFAHNSAVISADNYDQLNKLGEFLQRNPSVHVLLEAHSDRYELPPANDPNKNDPTEFQYVLAEERGEAVRRYLVNEYNLHEVGIDILNEGSFFPVSREEAPSERAENRRVDTSVSVTEKLPQMKPGMTQG